MVAIVFHPKSVACEPNPVTSTFLPTRSDSKRQTHSQEKLQVLLHNVARDHEEEANIYSRISRTVYHNGIEYK